MALPADYVKSTLVLASLQKMNFYNVFWWVPSPVPTYTGDPSADAVTIGGALGNHIISNLQALLTVNTTIVGVNHDVVISSQHYEYSQLIGLQGLVAGDELADFEAILIQKRTNLAGKSGRGRWFLGPVPESHTDENYVADAVFVQYQSLANTWKGAAVSLGAAFQSSLYSKKTNSLTALTGANVVAKIASIGGRKSRSIL